MIKSRNKKPVYNNPVLQVFTKEFKNETDYINLMRNSVDSFKFKINECNEDEIFTSLMDENYKSNFQFSIPEESEQNGYVRKRSR